MAMTLRLDDAEMQALRAQAEAEGRSMQAVASTAIREYVVRRARELARDETAARVVRAHAKAFDTLGGGHPPDSVFTK